MSNETPRSSSDSTRLGAMIVLSGPSGTGKSTVCGELFPRCEGLRFSVSCTTRAPRPGEIDGVHYHFTDVEDFQARIRRGEFLEWANVHGNYYGTPISEVAPYVRAGHDVMLDIDVQGQRQIVQAVQAIPDLRDALVTVFLAPPSLTVLEARLRGRGTESEESIQRRLGNARGELASWREYEFVVVNDDARKAADELEAILHAAHTRTQTLRKEPWNE